MRRLVLAMSEHGERRAFRLSWSMWRRAHHAVAARCHAARRVLARGHPRVARGAAPPLRAELTDAEWAAVGARLPPQRPPVGRPRHDYRTVLSGMLWVLRTRSSWRDMPRAFGKWETVYKRYRRWRDMGLWQQLVAALGSIGSEEGTEVSL